MSRWPDVIRWLAAIILLLASGWFFNVATYNWFSADFRGSYSRAYALRGNIFFGAALTFLAGFIFTVVALVRSRKKNHKENL